ncbi:MAG: Cystathionine beta-lyase [Candidatus Heimdallarchaeota archaeon LC_3]|nr:MAG: Cystathionine beta-lyase [Candidatus Heimdallarchaeota archaeon LC_3]
MNNKSKFKKKNINNLNFNSKVVHAGQNPDPTTGAILTPIYQTATYVLTEIGKNLGYEYSRTQNPTRTVLEDLVASLEGSKYAISFSTGMAAADAVIKALLKSQDHVVVCDDAYGGVYRLFEQSYRKYGLNFTYADTRYAENVKKAITSQTRLVWLETPTNPLLKVADLENIMQIINSENSTRKDENKIFSLVDNTFMTPYLFKPLIFGIDLILHSSTKFLSGHNQLVGGIVVVNDKLTKWYHEDELIKDFMGKPVIDPENNKQKTEKVNSLFTSLKFIQNSVGAVPGPMDCWLTILGIKTLAIRMERQDENANKIVSFLLGHSKVKHVNYPGLSSHINYEIAKTQMKGFGAIISFELEGGLEEGIMLMNNVELWYLAESLGAVESMITHPASMTHAAVPKEVREERGISDDLIRLSVGIESVEDLIQDLNKALDLI